MSTLTAYAALNTDYLLYDFTIYASTATITRTATEWRFTIPGTSSYTSSVTYIITGTGLPNAASSATFPNTGTITSIRGIDADGDDTFSLTGVSLSSATLAGLISANNIAGWQGELYGGVNEFVGDTTANVNMNAGAGADTLQPGDAAGSFIGGGGNDLFLVTNPRATLYGGADVDTISFQSGSGNFFANLAGSVYGVIGGPQASFYEFENARGGTGNDSFTGNNGDNLLDGAGGNDTLFGGAGNDTLRGGTGVDTISYVGASTAITVNLAAAGPQLTSVETGTDTIEDVENVIGGNGNDTLIGSSAANVLEGGAGNDSLNGGTGIDTASYAGAGSVNVSLAIAGAQNTGGAGTDTLVNIENLLGGTGYDTLAGRNTANRLDGGGGNDLLMADAGNDTLDGGAGFDRADYGAATAALTIDLSSTAGQSFGAAFGTDILLNIEAVSTGTGNDNIIGTIAANDIDGGAGDDTIEGGEGNDTLDGEVGIDTASFAGAGRGVVVSLTSPFAATNVGTDYLYNFENLAGSAYNDTLTGDGNANELGGGDGDDILLGGNGNDTLDGGDGLDTASYSNSFGVSVNLAIAGNQNTVNAGTDRLTSIENLIGSAYNDTLTGDNGANVIEGGGGNDEIVGGAGVDIASYAGSTLAVNVSLAIVGSQNTGGAGTDTLTQMEGLRGGSGDDTLTGSNTANVIEGGLGNDSLNGAAGNDTLSYATSIAGVQVSLDILTVQDTLGAGIDRAIGFENLAGGFGNDTLTGSDGANRLYGNGGDDVLIGGLGNDTLDGGDGFDAADYTAATTPLTIDLGLANGQVTGPFGTDTLLSIEELRLGSSADRVTGGTSAITVRGGNGNDTLTGGTKDDHLLGEVGNDSLNGSTGNDTLEGGAGNDSLTGGAGIDTASYESAAAGVRVSLAVAALQNTLGAGSDRLATIENLLGSAHDDTLTGSTADNDIRGGDGHDSINGAAGDDFLVGGQGDDTLIAGNGLDTLAGGGGNDVYEVQGTGNMLVEDASGIDTLDASGANAAAEIDLSGETVTTVGSRVISFGSGGTSRLPLDVVFLQDLSGSFGDDIQNVRVLAPQIVDAVQDIQVNSAFGVSSFVDKPIGPFGSPGDYVYRTDLSVTTNENAIATTYDNLIILSGNDTPESSLEGLLQVAVRPDEVGFRSDSARYVVLFTDAPYHVAGDGLAGGISNPNNGDDVLDGVPPGTGEDYPGVAQVGAALLEAGLVPIFAVTAGNEATYQNLVDQFGFGTVVQLTSDSSNVVSAITAGLTVATATSIENAIGTAFADQIIGSDVGNHLSGLAGNDSMFGRGGDDTIVGGAGNDSLDGEDGSDTASYEDMTNAVRVSLALQGAAQNTLAAGTDRLVNFENLMGGTGNDTLTGDTAANFLGGNDGDDRLVGGAGNDTLEGGLGEDAILGEDGIDVASYANAATAIRASLQAPGTNTGEANGDTYNSVEGLLGSAFNDTLTGNTVANILDGSIGDDTVSGLAGTDTIFGLVGDDSLSGGDDNDTISGGVGADTIEAGSGNDTADGGADDDWFVMSTTAGDVDTVYGGFGRDTASFADFTVGLTLNLNFITQTLPSSTAYLYDVENLRGGSGADSMTGSSLANVLEGMNGADTLIGGAGADTLTGGTGADVFAYLLPSDSSEALAGRDQITDFRTTQGDKIDVSAIDAKTTVAGNDAFTLVAGDFTGSAGEISIATWGTSHLVRFDTDGDGLSNFAMTVLSPTVLTASDFIL